MPEHPDHSSSQDRFLGLDTGKLAELSVEELVNNENRH